MAELEFFSGGPKLNRRRALQLAGASALASVAPFSVARAAPRPIKIGYVTPTTGPLAPMGEADDYILKGVREALKNGVVNPGGAYPIEILVKDSQSNPNRAAEVAGELDPAGRHRPHGRRRDARELQSRSATSASSTACRASRPRRRGSPGSSGAAAIRPRASTGPTTTSGASRTLSRSSPASGSRSTPTRRSVCSSPTTATATPGAIQNSACRRR